MVLKVNTIDSRKVKGEMKPLFRARTLRDSPLWAKEKPAHVVVDVCLPAGMGWWWWDSHVNDRCEVDVQVDEWPFPWGSLSWLLRAAGASEVMPEE